jgi:hypothetical protein
MSPSSESSSLRSLLGDAVDKYKEQVGTSLVENQLATQLEACDSVDSVVAVLEERVQAFRESLGRDRHPKMMKSVRRVVHVLHTISSDLGRADQVGHFINSVVRLSALTISVLLKSAAYFIAIPACEINICCHWYSPRSMCLPHP